MSNLLEQAYKDNRFILQDGGFERALTLKSSKNNYAIEYSVKGFLVNHNTSIDPDTGLLIDSRKIAVSINLNTLNEVNYPLYDVDKNVKDYPNVTSGDINMKDDKVSFKDSNLIIQEMIVSRYMVDYSLNHITLILVTTKTKKELVNGISRIR